MGANGRSVLSLVLLVLALIFSACGGSDKAPVTSKEVGSCASCHTDQATLVLLAIENEPGQPEDTGEG